MENYAENAQSEYMDWKSVSLELIGNPDSLELWEKLVERAELPNGKPLSKASSSESVSILRLTYNSLLAKFPLLEKYWIKYANFEFKNGNTTESIAIWEKAVAQVPYSLEIWIEYAKFLISVEGDDDKVLGFLERARTYIGKHYHCHEFYDLYLRFLKERGENDIKFMKLYALLLRHIIEIPIYHYSKFFKQFLADVIESGEYEAIIPYNDRQKFEKKDKNSISKLKKIFTDVYISTQYKSYDLYEFEQRLGRQYFHVAFLLKEQLGHWNSYLEFIDLKYPELSDLTYHRCIVATGMYGDFWLRYSDRLSEKSHLEETKQILRKGIHIVPMTRNGQLIERLIKIHLFQGNVINARDIIVENLKLFPNNLAMKLQLLNIEILIHHDDEEYIFKLLSDIASDSNDAPVLYGEVLKYDLSYEKMKKFFKESTIKNCEYYQAFIELIVLHEGATKEAADLLKQGEQLNGFKSKWSGFLGVQNTT